jgi:very-long-chain (3R)-3-hydroxyacyl-CoA dehydratase
MADTAAAPAKAPKRSSPVKNAYLILYNAVSAVAWLVVLGRTVAVFSSRGPSFVPLVVADWTRWTQTAAGMEILHSLFGAFLSHFPTNTSIGS